MKSVVLLEGDIEVIRGLVDRLQEIIDEKDSGFEDVILTYMEEEQ